MVGSTAHEIGGEFHLEDFPRQSLRPWPECRSFFATGRAALIALCKRWIALHSHARLLVPEYFCSEVIGSLRARSVPIVVYADDPLRSAPEFDRLPVSPWDMVLAVNYFGVRSGDQWAAWRDANPSIALIEDHTHDPQSSWARSSKADFAFASLRKTTPVPDGAIAWSPRGLPLPEAKLNGVSVGSSLKLAAMVYKRRYLELGETVPSLKTTFLGLQKRGERLLSESHDEGISAWSLGLVSKGLPNRWRSRRERNVQSLLELAPKVGGDGWPLFTTWPPGHCPFNAVYIFKNETARDSVRSRLIGARVYTPVHWPVQGAGESASDLSKRLLTIPVDFRCDDDGIRRVASLLAGHESTGIGGGR